MKILAGGSSICKSGPCPTLYRDKDGRLYVQGFKTPTETKGRMGMPENEDLVEISESLFEAMKKIE